MESMPILEFARTNQEPEWLQVKRQVVSEMLASLPIDDSQREYQFEPPMLIAQPVNSENLATGDLRQRGGIIMDLFAAANRYPNFIQENLMEKAIEWRENALNARHLSYLQSGGFVYIPPNTEINDPMDLSSLIDHQQQEKHLLIIVGAGSKVDFKFTDQSNKLQNDCLMVEVLIGDHAKVQYFDATHASATNYHHRILNAYLAQNAQLSTYVGLASYGALRYESNLSLDGQGSIGKINLISSADGDQRQSIYTSTTGEGPHTYGEINGYGFINASANVQYQSTGEIHEGSFESEFNQTNLLFEIGDLSNGIINHQLNVDNPSSDQQQTNQVIRISSQQLANYQHKVDDNLNDVASHWLKRYLFNEFNN